MQNNKVLPLTPEERQRLAVLEQEEAALVSNAPISQSGPVVPLSPEEQQRLAVLEQEEAALSGQARVNPRDEADLGFLTRVKYAIEPIESNRRALLTQQFGAENVKEDEKGDVYIRQGDTFLPVNKDGLSFTDLTDVAGSLPESLGAGAGAVLGLGAASVPGAIVGGATGSALRQSLSGLLGTPQVATPMERATETGLSGAFGGLGAFAGNKLKEGAKKLAPTLSKFMPNLKKDAFGERLQSIAKKEGIPELSQAQLMGEKSRELELEKILQKRPLFGYSTRKKVGSQVKKIKENLKDVVGDFVDLDSSVADTGRDIKAYARAQVDAIKNVSQSLYDEVGAAGAQYSIPAKEVRSKFVNNVSKLDLRLLDKKGNPLPYSIKSGLTPDQFTNVQGVVMDVMQGIGKEATNANDMDVLRKVVQSHISESKRKGFSDVALIKLREGLLDTTDEMLDVVESRFKTSGNTKLKEKHKMARQLWAEYSNKDDVLAKKSVLGLDELPDENVIESIFSDSKKADQFISIVDKETAEKAAMKYLNDLIRKKAGARGQVEVKALRETIDKKKHILGKVIDPKKIQKIKDNLRVLQTIGESVNPPNSGLIGVATDLSPQALIEGAVALGESKLRGSGRKIGKGLQKATKNASIIGAGTSKLLSDKKERESSYKTRAPGDR